MQIATPIGIVTGRRELRALQRAARLEAAKWPARMTPVAQDVWPKQDGLSTGALAIGVWRSNRFLAVMWEEPHKASTPRLSICRAFLGDDGRYVDGIRWEELQQVKDECGFADRDAVELYPAQRDIVDVANLRHLWLLPARSPLAWRDA